VHVHDADTTRVKAASLRLLVGGWPTVQFHILFVWPQVFGYVWHEYEGRVIVRQRPDAAITPAVLESTSRECKAAPGSAPGFTVDINGKPVRRVRHNVAAHTTSAYQ
jgi:hypothetical protein